MEQRYSIPGGNKRDVEERDGEKIFFYNLLKIQNICCYGCERRKLFSVFQNGIQKLFQFLEHLP